MYHVCQYVTHTVDSFQLTRKADIFMIGRPPQFTYDYPCLTIPFLNSFFSVAWIWTNQMFL